MSRIGKLPITLPAQVTCTIDGNKVRIEGPKGAIEKNFDFCVEITQDSGVIKVEPHNNSRLAKAMHGTARSVINGMVNGVVSGYTKNLEISGVGFKADLKGDLLDLQLGYSHPVRHPVPTGVKVTVEGGTKLKIEGIDKQAVGQLAASVKSYFPMEPYKGKGVRIVGEYVRRKEGKKTA